MKKKIEGILNEKLEKGISVSPVLPKGVKNYLIDSLMVLYVMIFQMNSQKE